MTLNAIQILAITAVTARIAHELMDPARKTPETPLEREQREVILQLSVAINLLLETLEDGTPQEQVEAEGAAQAALEAAHPFLED